MQLRLGHSFSHSPVPQAQVKALYRQSWKEVGGPARCPRLAIGHPDYDPTLIKDDRGYYLRHTEEVVRGLFAPRKTLPTPGAHASYVFCSLYVQMHLRSLLTGIPRSLT